MKQKMMKQPDNKRQGAEDGKRTSMNIALTSEDKQFLKIYAAKHDTNVAAMIAEYVEALRHSVDM